MAFTTIDDPSAYFQTTLYTGDGTSSLAITNSGNSDLQADWIWIKERNGTRDHSIFDSVRGVVKRLESNTTNAEGDETAGLLSLNSNGFTVGADGYVNTDDNTYVAWCWKESATAGFDILTYTGNGTAGRTVSHNLSAVPHVIIQKIKSSTGNWLVYHHKNTSSPETDFLRLNTTDATADESTIWNDTAPTSSVFSVGTESTINGDGNTFVAYLFSEKQGFSKFGSYTGNGNADGAFIYTGFKPAWVMGKASSRTENWYMFDNKRDPFNPGEQLLKADENSAEFDGSDIIDFTSTGFKLRSTNEKWNENGTSYIFIAFAEAPFVNSKGVPCNAR